MMSNPPSSLPPQPPRGKVLHRRQHSTPVNALEAMRVSNDMPPHQQQLRPGPQHRRGLSYDQQQRSPIRRQQPGSMVSIANLQHNGHQILREAQQQKIARPGQQHMQQQHHHHQMHSHSLPVSSQCGFFPSPQPSSPFDPHMAMSSMMQPSSGMQFASSPFFASPGLFNSMTMVDENNPHCIPQQVQAMPVAASAMFDTRRMSQPDLRLQTRMRPCTPQDQIQSANYPLTPPCTQTVRHMQYTRSQQTSPSIQSPIPVAMQRGHSLQGIIEHEESKEETPQRPRPRSMMVTSTAQSFQIDDLAPTTADLLASNADVLPEPQKDEPLPFFDETGGEEPSQESHDCDHSSPPRLDSKPVPVLVYAQSSQPRGSVSPSRPALSPRRMSISDLHLEPGISASIEETNITLDDIAQFIEGPMPEDNKWVCRYEDCNKRFGRKENIKSHVQTHLGDRQFRCDHCKKCFVRGHDLKRHAKIHTGSKPYPCLCGNSFARHDALTRHRQRGMCIGAFEGVVKKVIKRGRPRKHRPDMDDRLDKANRTRAKNDLPHSSGQADAYYLSSGSSDGSMSSWGSPPTENMDNLSIRGGSPFDDPVLFGVNVNGSDLAATMTNMNNLEALDMGLAPSMFSFTPPASPGFSTGNVPSPPEQGATPITDICDIVNLRSSTPHSEHASLAGLVTDQVATSVAAITTPIATPIPDAHLHTIPVTTQVSQSQISHSLPGLSHTSSSPAPQIDAFDFPEMPQQTPTMISNTLLPSKIEEQNDFDTLFDYGMDINPDTFFANM